MRRGACYFSIVMLFSFASNVRADVGFSKEDVELVKSACLVGDSLEFSTEADGSLSIKNLEGKGKISVKKSGVNIVDVPDPDKRAEFDAIRKCIKDYLKDKSFDSNNGKIVLTQNFFLGRWSVQQNIANYSGGSMMDYRADGTFTGYNTEFIGAIGQKIQIAGRWGVTALSPDTFQLTLIYNNPQLGKWTRTFKYIDQDHVQNIDENYVAVRLK